jgi:hypothetical protein
MLNHKDIDEEEKLHLPTLPSVVDTERSVAKITENGQLDADNDMWEMPSIEPSEWPYLREGQRLAEIDYEEIIEKGEPWTDELFPPDLTSLFINEKHHERGGKDSKFKKKKIWSEYEWIRASDHFKNIVLFNSIEPDDVK